MENGIKRGNYSTDTSRIASVGGISPRHIVVVMPYPGAAISVNHYLGRRADGRSYVKPKAKAWMDGLGWQLKLLHLEDWQLPLHIICVGYFRDEHHAPDIANLSKVVLDAIEAVTGLNDKDFRWHDGARFIDPRVEPSLFITIQEEDPGPRYREKVAAGDLPTRDSEFVVGISDKIFVKVVQFRCEITSF